MTEGWDLGGRGESVVCLRKLTAVVIIITNYLHHGLQTPNETFFSSNSQTFGLGQTICADKFWGTYGILGRFISTHFGTVSPLSMFSINQPLFLQKTKPLYQNSKYLFGIGI